MGGEGGGGGEVGGGQSIKAGDVFRQNQKAPKVLICSEMSGFEEKRKSADNDVSVEQSTSPPSPLSSSLSV